MAATAIVPVKRFSAAKTRLAGSAASSARAALAAAMLADVLAALGRSAEVERVIVVSGEPAAVEAARAAGAETIDDPLDAGHSEAASLGVRAALGAGARIVALLPGDCPLLDPGELDRALRNLEPGSAGVVPDRHGSGTNALLLDPPGAIDPAFGPGSRARHLELARSAGVRPLVIDLPSLELDLDTADDLAELTVRLRAEPKRAPRTAAALEGVVPR
jgi:2-phospho-L-lactate guanylyltransferase